MQQALERDQIDEIIELSNGYRSRTDLQDHQEQDHLPASSIPLADLQPSRGNGAIQLGKAEPNKKAKSTKKERRERRSRKITTNRNHEIIEVEVELEPWETDSDLSSTIRVQRPGIII
jgi:hypothetical protein